MEESWRGADHTQTSWGAADRCHESTAVIGAARMEGEERPELKGGGRVKEKERKVERRVVMSVTDWKKEKPAIQSK